MKTAIIIEDEIPAGIRLEKLLISKNILVLAKLYSVKNSLLWLKENNHPEIIFIDVKLRDGNCFEILDQNKIQSKIVFTTAYNEFALDAFSYNSIDYLLKPIDEEKLNKLLNKIETLKIGFQNEVSWTDFNEDNSIKTKKSFLVSSGSILKKILDTDIICFYSHCNVTYLLSKENRSFIVNNSLEKLEDELDDELFFRINRKFIVNKTYVISVKNVIQKQVILSVKTDFDLIVSKSKTKLFIEWYKK